MDIDPGAGAERRWPNRRAGLRQRGLL